MNLSSVLRGFTVVSSLVLGMVSCESDDDGPNQPGGGAQAGDGEFGGSGGAAARGGSSGEGGEGGDPAGGNPNGGEPGGNAGDAGVGNGTSGEAGSPAIGECRDGSRRSCCRTGTLTCVGGVWGTCIGGVPPSGESCNGEDDDCDGVVDELGTVTCGMGACLTTVPACSGGTVSACLPTLPATSLDGCNGTDDDCDGAVDEDCAPCIHVSPTGNDVAAGMDAGTTPFRNVQSAIDFADTHRNVATRVCVAAGAACGADTTYSGPSAGEFSMRDGISVLGNYESTGWTRCLDSTTHLAPETAAGITFPAAISTQTILDGFIIDRFAAPTTAAVTVDGARGAVLANITVPAGPSVTNSYGVNVINGGEAVVFRSRIEGGLGASVSIGVRAVGSRVTLEENCPSSPDPASGRCEAGCSGSGPSIRATATGSTPARADAVLLDSSPESRIGRSALCTDGSLASNSATSALRIGGAAAGIVVRANVIEETSGPQDLISSLKHAILAEDCAGGEPWIADNHSIRCGDGAFTNAIEGIGDCHPVIDSNRSIVSSAEGSGRLTAVRCAARNGIASRCVISGNLDVASEGQGNHPLSHLESIGVACDGGSCTRIDRNSITGLRRAFGFYTCNTCRLSGVGINLGSGGTLIDGNVVYGGCPNLGSVVGISADDTHARLINNRVFAFQESACGNEIRHDMTAVGLRIVTRAGGAEIDVNSNYLSGGVGQLPPSSFARAYVSSISILLQSSAPGPVGIFRNNVFVYGPRETDDYVPFREDSAAADPRLFENNNIPNNDPDVTMYIDEGTTNVTRASTLDALTDTTVSGTLDAACAFSADGHLLPGAACIDAGTASGAPDWDMDGQRRGAAPDIGPDEYAP